MCDGRFPLIFDAFSSLFIRYEEKQMEITTRLRLPTTLARSTIRRSARSSSSNKTNLVPSAMQQQVEPMPSFLCDPQERDARYGKNVAKFLLDCESHPSTTFNFCGGMRFGLSFTRKLRERLEKMASSDEGGENVIVQESNVGRMYMMDGYVQSAYADNVSLFHGREVRRVSTFGEKSGMMIQLSLANEDDNEGWTKQEIEEYSGWLSDQQRRWRDGDVLESEGVANFKDKYGPEAYTLHHRFYLHSDNVGGFWLSAEDGCEGVAQDMNSRRDGLGAKNALRWW